MLEKGLEAYGALCHIYCTDSHCRPLSQPKRFHSRTLDYRLIASSYKELKNLTHVLNEGDILYKPLDTSIFYEDSLPRPFIKVHKIMPLMVDILPLANVVTPVEGSEFWHCITAGGPYLKSESPPLPRQQAKPAATAYSFGESTTTKNKKVVASTAAAQAITRSQLHRVGREDFGRGDPVYRDFIPWTNESLYVALHKPKLKVGYQGDSVVAESASISPGSVIKIPSGIRLAAGEAEFNAYCLASFEYLPQELSVSWVPVSGFPRVKHNYLVLREKAHLSMLKLRWPDLLWQ